MSFQDFIADTVEDCVRHRINSNRDRTALDHFELQLMDQIAENRYNNDTFWKIVDAIEERVDEWEDELLRENFEREAVANVNDFIDCLMADTLIKARALDKLNDNDYYFIEDIANSDVYRLLFESRGRSRSRRESGYRDDRGGRGAMRVTPRRDSRDMRGSRPGVSGLREPVRDMTHKAKRAASSNNAFVHAARIRERDLDVSEEIDDIPRRTRSRGDEPQRERTPREERVAAEAPVRSRTSGKTRVLNPPPAASQGYDHTSEAPYEEFWEDDCLWQASVKSDWKLTGEGADSYLKLYNIYKYVSYYVMDEFGNVTQRFKEVNDENRYLNQSLLKDPDSYKSNFGRKPPKLSQLMKGNVDTAEVNSAPEVDVGVGYELEDMIDLTQSDLDEVYTMIPSDNLSTSAIEARMRLSKEGRSSSLNIFMLMDPIEAVSVSEASMIKDLYSVNTLMSLSKNLEGLRGKISNANFNRINNKISDYLMDMLKNTFGVPLKKLEFASDWPTVIQGLVKRYGQEWVDTFARRANSLIPTILSVVDVVDEDGNIDPVFENIVTEHNKDRIIPYVDFYAMVSINCTLDQLSIGRQIELESPLILRAMDDIYSTSALISVLSAVDEIREAVTVSRLLLSTTCGALVEVTRHELGNSNIVLSMFTPRK